tara:strand:- start:510 stop:722 length:213 start_codon:yes stop_codon:yes gene_type:complete
MSESENDSFVYDLVKACDNDVWLKQEVIARYVSNINDEERTRYQNIIDAQKREKAKQPYTLDSYNAQCQL